AGALLLIGVFGASLFYGDAVLTPAISVLSAIEGLEAGTSAFRPYIVPRATATLVALCRRHQQRTDGDRVTRGRECAPRLERRAAHRRSVCRRDSVLPLLSRVGALSDGGARDRGDGDRLPGDDLRRVLDHAAGDPARLPPAHDRAPHLGARDGPDLRTGGELD